MSFTKGTKGTKGDALIVAVRCEGRGDVKVVVKPVNSSFQLPCVDGKVNTTYNQLALAGAEKAGTVAVSAPTTVTWSLTVGRGDRQESRHPGERA
ncbi:hypothetical protein ACIRF8_35175 [Streptomyces sp. NPDC102406]|uniref:hypothetical protein n=1 Tax=Streptomyces sp. NPDC102406 TaxID=3366171 RepID=UPI0038022B50